MQNVQGMKILRNFIMGFYVKISMLKDLRESIEVTVIKCLINFKIRLVAKSKIFHIFLEPF